MASKIKKEKTPFPTSPAPETEDKTEELTDEEKGKALLKLVKNLLSVAQYQHKGFIALPAKNNKSMEYYPIPSTLAVALVQTLNIKQVPPMMAHVVIGDIPNKNYKLCREDVCVTLKHSYDATYWQDCPYSNGIGEDNKVEKEGGGDSKDTSSGKGKS